MSDAITSALARNIALKFARSAIKSGSITELKSALKGLPTNGQKAGYYRREIETRLARGETGCEKINSETPVGAKCIADGISYHFSLYEFSDVAFFRAMRNGTVIDIAINSAHPFGREISEAGRLSDPLLMAMLASWAHFELDQVSEKRKAVVSEARVDWGRILRRLISSSEGFTVNGPV